MFNRQKDVTILDHQQADVQSLGLIGRRFFGRMFQNKVVRSEVLSNAQADVRYMMAFVLSHNAPERAIGNGLHKWSVAKRICQNTHRRTPVEPSQLHASLLEQEVCAKVAGSAGRNAES
ncbi:hypothetical protein BV898_09124 [Hypsibius exemplaris]|uniref:Uncharacterized protein n=1 Tax=Hypsibius exemplaris TaxID=2072580 RepID=A0A1W0WNN5_HYPEX|nr:hypothetical protein BV898_09124 [Hypsibius exemplaris]